LANSGPSAAYCGSRPGPAAAREVLAGPWKRGKGNEIQEFFYWNMYLPNAKGMKYKSFSIGKIEES
jgi:hypothetical protein